MEQGQVPAAFRKPDLTDRAEVAGSPSGQPSREEMAQALQELVAQARSQPQAPPGQQWQCVSCVNRHKVKLAELMPAWEAQGIRPPSQEFMRAMQSALQLGQAAIAGGAPELPREALPPVNMATMMANGNSLCAACLQPTKPTSLILGSAGMSMSGLLRT